MQDIPNLQKEYETAMEAGGQDKLYYFNANHLGSGSLITDGDGQTYQTLAYAPYGEDLVNIRWGNYEELRQFGGHLKDEESGLLYMGARYNAPPLSIEISSDAKWYLFPHITSYNSMGNNPINFVDPDGNQAIHHTKSRIIAQYGQIRVKLENLHNYTRNQILAFNNNPQNWKAGEIGVSMEVAHLRYQPISTPDIATMDNTHGAAIGNPTEHTVQNPTTKSSNYTQTDKRYNTQTVSGASGMTKGAAKGMLVLDILIGAFQVAGGWSIYDDMNKMQANLELLKGSVRMVNSAAASGMIPEQYQNQTNMLDILNVVYQGENTTQDKNIMNIGIQILKANNMYDPNKIKQPE
jgi:RHS repeat-associated protein